jgi:transcriptional regulator with XRE-family HTH domain
MRITSPRDLGLFVRDRRQQLRQSQTALAEAASVSRRWLSDLEAGKPTAEVGLVFRTLDALGIILDARLDEVPPGQIDLDDHLSRYRLGGVGTWRSASTDQGGDS